MDRLQDDVAVEETVGFWGDVLHEMVGVNPVSPIGHFRTVHDKLETRGESRSLLDMGGEGV